MLVEVFDCFVPRFVYCADSLPFSLFIVASLDFAENVGVASLHLLLSEADNVDVLLELSLRVGVVVLHEVLVAFDIEFLRSVGGYLLDILLVS